MRSEMVMSCPFGLRCRLAAIEPFGVDDALLLEITQRLIEGLHRAVIGAHHLLQLFDAAPAQPVFRGIHHDAAISFVATIGIDGDVIDPAAMAVMSDQNRGDDAAAVTPGQHRRIRSLARERDVGGGIVPGPRQAAAPPQRNHLGDVGVFDRRDRERRGRDRHFCYSTLPGFMIPCGSSIALMPRISSIATLSLTSGNSSRLSTPMPCSAEIDPPIRSTISNTTALTSCQRARKSAALAPTGWLTL